MNSRYLTLFFLGRGKPNSLTEIEKDFFDVWDWGRFLILSAWRKIPNATIGLENHKTTL